jgi:hypothetical protein
MRLGKNIKPTSINVVVVWPRQIERRKTPTLDLASSTNNKHCLPTTTIVNNNLHHHRHSSLPSPPHTNTDGPPARRYTRTKTMPRHRTSARRVDDGTHQPLPTPRRVDDVARQRYPLGVPQRRRTTMAGKGGRRRSDMRVIR